MKKKKQTKPKKQKKQTKPKKQKKQAKPKKHTRPKKQTKQKRTPKDAIKTIDVFTSSWSGSVNEPFDWSNGTAAPVLVSQEGNNTFPFVTNPPGGNSISVSPGMQPCQLIGVANNLPYPYRVTPSPDLGNPKTVIIR